jgi:hypothetical protein
MSAVASARETLQRSAAIADGRRIHDLRHTAACLWLARGVDPVTVQAWMGHASIATTICTCITWAPPPTGPGWPGSTRRRGAHGVHRESRLQNHKSVSRRRSRRLT